MKIAIRIALACAASSCLAAEAGAQTVQTLFDPVVLDLGAPGGTPYSAETVNLSSPGSGTNGPQTAQVGVNVRCSKSNYLSAETVGEVDCLYATLRQDGPNSDGSGLLVDTQNTGMGFLSDTEMVASSVNRATNAVNLALDIQEGVINLGTTMYGAVYSAKTGQGDTGLLVQASAGAGWNYALRAMNGSGVQYFSLDGQGNTIQNGTARINGVTVDGVLQASASPVEGVARARMIRKADCGTTMRSTSDTSLTLTVPNGLPVGCRIGIIQAGRGAVLIAGGGAMRSERLDAQSATQKTQGRFAEASLLIDGSSFLVGGEVSDAGGAALADADRAGPSPTVSLTAWQPDAGGR